MTHDDPRINIKKAGLVIKSHAPNVEKPLRKLIDFFGDRNIEVILEKEAARKLDLGEGVERKNIAEQVHLLVVLGGDGTLLSIAHLAARENIPVLGVNLGRLGFLTEVPQEEMTLTLEAYFSGNRKIISRRQMLEVVFREKTYICLNDMVINKGALARMIQFEIWIDGKEISVPRADGLIISTPTGSTAYSLSAGGPIIQPHLPAVIIAPICPHTLSFRPMVISSESRIRIRLLTGGEKVFLTLDGQRGNLMELNETVDIRHSRHELQLISSPERNYFDLLQEKLGWG